MSTYNFKQIWIEPNSIIKLNQARYLNFESLITWIEDTRYLGKEVTKKNVHKQ